MLDFSFKIMLDPRRGPPDPAPPANENQDRPFDETRRL
jgi:hypothetical protein